MRELDVKNLGVGRKPEFRELKRGGIQREESDLR